jgi:hypothetical protein
VISGCQRSGKVRKDLVRSEEIRQEPERSDKIRKDQVRSGKISLRSSIDRSGSIPKKIRKDLVEVQRDPVGYGRRSGKISLSFRVIR